MTDLAEVWIGQKRGDGRQKPHTRLIRSECPQVYMQCDLRLLSLQRNGEERTRRQRVKGAYKAGDGTPSKPAPTCQVEAADVRLNRSEADGPTSAANSGHGFMGLASSERRERSPSISAATYPPERAQNFMRRLCAGPAKSAK